MSDIYDQHRAAFANIAAYVVAKGDNQIATVAFKRAKSGLRVTCYLHIHGTEMVRVTSANESAAMRTALSRITAEEGDVQTIQRVGAFRDAVTDNGASWDQDLRKAGFSVWQAV